MRVRFRQRAVLVCPNGYPSGRGYALKKCDRKLLLALIRSSGVFHETLRWWSIEEQFDLACTCGTGADKWGRENCRGIAFRSLHHPDGNPQPARIVCDIWIAHPIGNLEYHFPVCHPAGCCNHSCQEPSTHWHFRFPDNWMWSGIFWNQQPVRGLGDAVSWQFQSHSHCA